MKYILCLLLFCSHTVYAVDCEKHQIYCDIVKLKPTIKKKYAMQLSNHIYTYSKLFGTDPKLSVAIAMQEHSFKNKNRMGVILDENNQPSRGPTDLGIFQLHVATLEYMDKELKWDIDYARIPVDIEYQTALHMRWLKRRILQCKIPRIIKKRKVRPGTEWACYHSYTPSKRETYFTDVSRHLDKISDPQ